MTNLVQTHGITLSMVKAFPEQIHAGTALAIQIRVACSFGCDLEAGLVRIVDAQGIVKGENTAANGIAEFAITAPSQPGEYTWTAQWEAREKTIAEHADAATAFSFFVKPHTIGMAVWDVPSPIVFGTSFKIKVGAECSARCNLGGRKISIHDHQGTHMTTGTLGEGPWSEGSTLFWTEAEMRAPDQVGQYVWESRFAGAEMEPAHESEEFSFAFSTANPPDRIVTITVVDAETQSPIPGADVLLHPYRGMTDESGRASLTVPAGSYEVYVCAHQKQIAQTRVAVSADAAVMVEMMDIPPVSE